jgi:hypothetical protein
LSIVDYGAQGAACGGNTEWTMVGAAFPAGQTLGQTANFRQTAPEIGVSPGFVMQVVG